MPIAKLLVLLLNLSLIFSFPLIPTTYAGEDELPKNEEEQAALEAELARNAQFWASNYDGGIAGRASIANSSTKLEEKALIVVGMIPAEYIAGQSGAKSVLGYVAIDDKGLISAVVAATEAEAKAEAESQEARLIIAKTGKSYDTLYPGLIDLHGHNKQNVLGTWESAKGRYSNRFEWRQKEPEYQRVQSQNMNPWSGNAAAKVAAYRWSEMQAMVLGTAYLQGAIQAHRGFAIHSVEDSAAYRSKRSGIQSPGDIIDPAKWSFLWNELRPIITQLGCVGTRECYSKAVSQFLLNKCQGVVPQAVVQDPMADDSVSWLLNHVEYMFTITKGKKEVDPKDAARKALPKAEEKLAKAEKALEAAKTKDEKAVKKAEKNLADAQAEAELLKGQIRVKACDIPKEKQDEFINYFAARFGNLPHKEVVSRNNYLDDPKRSSIITHLAEGRREDPYNWTEFQLFKLAGLAREGMNFVHGLGLTPEDYVHMAENNMGVVWSPYSNFLLYGETLDLRAVLNARAKDGRRVTVALGSDWTPTGSKGVLDELKLAVDYRKRLKISEKDLSDQDLYYMVTRNSAQIMNHFGFEKKGEHGIGTLQKGAMGTLIAVTTAAGVTNPYTNLVVHARTQDVNLLVIDGKAQYGNEEYLKQYDKESVYEVISGKIFGETLVDVELADTAEKGGALVKAPGKKLTIEGRPSAFPFQGLAPDADKMSEEELKKAKDDIATDEEILEKASRIKLADSDKCDWGSTKKAMMIYHTGDTDSKTAPLAAEFDVDLDTYTGIVRYLGISLLSQGRNVVHEDDGQDPKVADDGIRFMPPLYGCDDDAYTAYLATMVGNTLDEMADKRVELRLERKFFSKGDKQTLPHDQADQYQLPYTQVTDSGRIVDIWLDKASSAYLTVIEELEVGK